MTFHFVRFEPTTLSIAMSPQVCSRPRSHQSTRPQRINNSWVQLCRLRMMETNHSLSVAYLSGIAHIRKSSQ